MGGSNSALIENVSDFMMGSKRDGLLGFPSSLTAGKASFVKVYYLRLGPYTDSEGK